MSYLCAMIRENIVGRLYDLNMTQRAVSKTTGIEYSALNLFLNGRKGLWYNRIQSILDVVGLTATGSIKTDTPLSIQKSCWMEIRESKKSVRRIAEDLDIGYCTLSNFLHGRIGMSVEKVERLMEYLNIKLLPM